MEKYNQTEVHGRNERGGTLRNTAGYFTRPASGSMAFFALSWPPGVCSLAAPEDQA